MKLILCAVLTLLGICSAYPNYVIRNWGNVDTTQEFATEMFMRQPFNPNGPTNETFTFPRPGWQNDRQITIQGIKLLDYGVFPADITFLSGGIRASDVTINIVSPRGYFINCILQFFFVPRAIDDRPQIVQEFLESEINIDFTT